MAASAIIDPTKPGQYPVVLSDSLLGKPSKETYTGVNYNHRPTLSSDNAPITARLKKSAKDESYNLGFDDQGNRYQYNGVRTTDDGNYVLIFDPIRKVFVLDRVDSTFHMNLTRTPTNSNGESLRKQFPQLEVKSGNTTKQQKRSGAEKPSASKATAAKAKGGNASAKQTPKSKGSMRPEKGKAMALTLPDMNAASANSLSLPTTKQQQLEKKAGPAAESETKSKPRARSPVDSEEDDDDDDGGLTVEYPGGNPSAFQPTNFSTAFPVAVTRRFSEFARDIKDEEEDTGDNLSLTTRGYGGYGGYGDDEKGYEEEEEEEEEEDEEEEDTQLRNPPASAAVTAAVEPERYTFDDGDEDADGNDDDAMDQDFGDLEAEMEREFNKVQNQGHESDSSVSEEE